MSVQVELKGTVSVPVSLPERVTQGRLNLATTTENDKIQPRLRWANRAIVIAESLSRVITAIRIARARWQSWLPPKHRN